MAATGQIAVNPARGQKTHVSITTSPSTPFTAATDVGSVTDKNGGRFWDGEVVMDT